MLNSVWFNPRLSINVLNDESDNKFLEVAVEANAAYIVTGNSSDFIIKDYKGIFICSLKDYYNIQLNSSF